MGSSADMKAQAFALAALRWQMEAGVDETLSETPLDRSAALEAPQGLTPANLTPAKRIRATASPQESAPQSDTETDARRLAREATDLAGVKAALAAFEGSALKAGARQAVVGDGHPNAWTMVIGEAPGRDEDREGRPFVGRSGQLLDRMMAAIGLSRMAQNPDSALYIANVLPYRPVDNRTPSDDEVALLLPFLRKQIALVKPKLILCLGNVPAKHLMQADAGITRFRGTWRDIDAGAGDVDAGAESISALASFHPAYLLRSPDMKRLAWRDLLEFHGRLAQFRP